MIRYVLVNTESGTPAQSGFPTDSQNVTNFGFNVPSGNLESVIFRFTGTLTNAAALTQDFAGCIAALRVIVNGETCFDHRAGYSDPSNDTTASQMGYFMNSIGMGLSSAVVASSTAQEAYFRVPLGRVLDATGVSRIEYTLTTAALSHASTGTQVEVWCVYNDAMTTRTTIPPATSFTSGGSGQENVTVRIPANQPGVVAGLLIQGPNDTDGSLSEIRLLSQSEFSLETNYWRFLANDLRNGVIYQQNGNSATEMSFAQLSPGAYFIPTFGLSRNTDDLRVQITTSVAQQYLFTPVLVASVSAGQGMQAVQTQAVRTNTSQAILDISGAADA